jgi:hypothetical protein
MRDMRSRILLAAASTAVLAATMVVAPPAAFAAAAPPTQVTAFHLPISPIDLENPRTDRTITAHIVDPVGIDPGFFDDQSGRGAETETFACVDKVGATQNGCYVHAGQLTSGTATDGVWTFDPIGEVSVHNWFRVVRLHLVRIDGTTLDVDLNALGFATTFRTISRWGAFVDRTSPATNQDTVLTYGAGLTLRGREYYVDEFANRFPIGHRRVEVRVKYENSPVIDGTEPIVATATTEADGTYAVTVHPDQHAFRYYVEMAAGTTDEGIRYMDSITWTGRVDVRVNVSVSSRPVSLPARTIGNVEGAVAPVLTGPVYLQRWSGGAFQTVSSATVGASGSFTLAAQPPKGTWRYRVYQPGDATHLGNTSAEFAVTGT